MVDGVKCYDTDRLGNPIATSATYEAVTLNGVAGTYVSTPDSVANSITGDIDIRVKAALADWTPADANFLISKTDSAVIYSYGLAVQPTGTMSLVWSGDGSTLKVATSSVAVSVTDGATKWVRVTLDVDNGAAGQDVYFYTSDDGVSWTQLGTKQTVATVGAIFNGTQPVRIGAVYSGGATYPLSGKIYQAQIYNGINGTLAVDFNAARYSGGGTTLTGSTGETWTLNGSAYIPVSNYPIVGYVPWEAQTNIALQSQNYAVTWTTTDYTITSTNNTAPDGTATASLMTEGSAGTATISQPVTATANANYSYYRYIKRSNNDWWQLAVYNGGNVVRAWFNLATGVKGSTSVSGTATVVSTAMTPAVNGWYRCEINVNIGSGATAIIFQGNSAAADASTARVNSAAAYMWGNQFNDSASFAAPYVPTTTVAVARNADVLTYTGADVANIKTLACTFSRVVGPNGGVCCALSNGTLSQRAQVAVGTTDVTFYGDSAGVKWNQTASNAYVIGTTAKVAFSMATNDIKMDFNGTSQTPDTVATLPTVTQLNVGHVAEVGVLNGAVKHVYGWTRNLSQSELGAIDRA
jgi:hypothetical protein